LRVSTSYRERGKKNRKLGKKRDKKREKVRELKRDKRRERNILATVVREPRKIVPGNRREFLTKDQCA
ncbi:hypothetical protein, partial [Ochrobactrum sp. SFR4]|uniref:hypothetical protein n=1 Tax=Ochrobactrum sp. SFR4 TaxID=2717368 RepID=UPI001C8B2508